MSAPVILPWTVPIQDIDPQISYTWPIAVQDETSLGFVANPNYTISLSGRAIILKYIGPFLTVPTIVPITIWASNADGTAYRTLKPRIQPYTELLSEMRGRGEINQNVFTGAATNGSANIAFTQGTIGAHLGVDDCVVLFGGGFGTNADGVKRSFVVSVSGSNFQVSLTKGGTALVATLTETVYILIGLQAAGSDKLRVPTAGLSVNDPIQLARASDGAILGQITDIDIEAASPALVGPYQDPYSSTPILFIKTIVDAYHLKVSATPGGAAITATESIAFSHANWWTHAEALLDLTLSRRSYPRKYPFITSSGFGSLSPHRHAFAPADDVDISLEDDIGIDVANWQVQGLPQGLVLVNHDITGTAPPSGYYVITVIGRYGPVASVSTSINHIIIQVGP